ncbi:MAG: hypothetical protein K9L30_01195 [Desulfobacterales bacterium]|nr:hypothetical protein [Desulfobacterales bacterium]
MLPSLKNIIAQVSSCDSFTEKLSDVYGQMDKKYNECADHYGFNCTGCEDNCCMTLFYHHTYIEYLYIYKGFMGLDPETRYTVKKTATGVSKKIKAADNAGIPPRVMCPLNFEGRCKIYHYRPMVCRLHGLPHELSRMEGNILKSPGCKLFTDEHGKKAYFPFDRTPFYIEMARLEQSLQQKLKLKGRIKMTISEMIETFEL